MMLLRNAIVIIQYDRRRRSGLPIAQLDMNMTKTV